MPSDERNDEMADRSGCVTHGSVRGGCPCDFCAHGKLFAPMPRLEVDGAGMLS